MEERAGSSGLALLEKTEDTDSPELNHYYCLDCYPESSAYALAFCGTDISGESDIDNDDDVDCIVCKDLDVCPNVHKYGWVDEVKFFDL